jgi:hypothetical protein
MLGKVSGFRLGLMPVRRVLRIDCIKMQHGLQRFSFHGVLSSKQKQKRLKHLNNN